MDLLAVLLGKRNKQGGGLSNVVVHGPALALAAKMDTLLLRWIPCCISAYVPMQVEADAIVPVNETYPAAVMRQLRFVPLPVCPSTRREQMIQYRTAAFLS